MNSLSDFELDEIVRRVVRRTMRGKNPGMSAPLGEDAFTAAPAPSGENQASSADTRLEAGRRRTVGSVALGADHGGYALKEALKVFLGEKGYNVVDCGTHSPDAVDYPDYAAAVALLVSKAEAWRGIIIDGAGIGSCIVANKYPGVRAAMCYDHATAVNSREHNDANILTLGAGLIGQHLAQQIVATWLETDFGGGRHARRVDKIIAIETKLREQR